MTAQTGHDDLTGDVLAVPDNPVLTPPDGTPIGTDNPDLLALGARPFRHLCPEADMRDAMSDEDFWAHVFRQDPPDGYDPDDDPNIPDQAEYELEARLASPCPECGQVGACAYDTEGRALIHVTEDDDS